MMNFRGPAERWSITLNIETKDGVINAHDLAAIIKAAQYDRFWLSPRTGLILDSKEDTDGNVCFVAKFDQCTDKGAYALNGFIKGIAYQIAMRYDQEAVAYLATDTAEINAAPDQFGFGGPKTGAWEPWDRALFNKDTGINSQAILLT